MYLNRLLFPAPHSSYDLKLLESHLLFFPREKSKVKNFKIKRKRLTKSEEKKKPIENTKSSNSLTKEFKEINRYSDKMPRHKRSGSLDSTPEPKKLAYIDEDIPNERSCVVGNQEDEEAPENYKYLTHLGSAEYQKKIKDLPEWGTQEEEAKNYSDKNDNRDDKQKKKKKKANCFGFLVKMNKDKKVDLELFNGSHEHNGFKFNTQQELNQLSPEVIHEIIQKKGDMQKDSSSESEDEHVDHPDPMSKKLVFIPCLFLPAEVDTTRTLLYFHGNGEDIYQSLELIRALHKNLMVNVLAIEYPGYGIYKGSPSERKILLDAETVYNYLTHVLKIKEKDIYLFGRSIGSGPACWLSSVKNPGLLILMSAFTSIRGVVKHLGGSFAQYFVKERFKNVRSLESAKCPVFIVHGKKDTLIPYKHANKLYDAIPGTNKKLHLSENMTHVDYDYYEDIGVPLTNFLKECNLLNFQSKTGEGSQKPNFEIFRKPNADLIKKLEPYSSEALKKESPT